MFGIMKRGPRLPYCGLCKTLGAEYGHQARFLLNHDLAFLAEVLLDLAGVSLAGPGYRSFNCLSLPREREEIPAVMRYVAAVTVALAYFRAIDHCRDARRSGQRFGWSLAMRALSARYRAATEQLRACGFPIDNLASVLQSQPERESNPRSLAHVAEPTMEATAMVFAHGVQLAGRADRCDHAWSLGYRFGELVYLMDAFEDRAPDARSGHFNPFLAFPESVETAQAEILSIVSLLEREMSPVHGARLRENVEQRLGLRPRVLQSACHEPLRDRLQGALAFARSLRSRENAGLWKGAAITASVATLAFFFPHHARRADSWQQCLGVSMNLMALGAVFATPPQIPRQYPMAQPDKPTASVGGCKDCCTDCFIEGIADAICGN